MKLLTLTAALILLLPAGVIAQYEKRNFWGAGVEVQVPELRTDTMGHVAGGLVFAYSRALYQEKDFGFHLDLRPKLLFDQSANVALGGSITMELRVLGMTENYPIGFKYGWGYHFMNYSGGDKPGFNLNGINYNKIGVLFPSPGLINEAAFILYHYQGQLMFGVSVISVNLFNQKQAPLRD